MRAFAERHELVLAMLLSARKAHQCNLSLPLCLLPNCRTCGFHTNEIYRVWVAFKHRQRKNSEHSQRLTAEACSDVQADSVQPPSLPSRMFLKWLFLKCLPVFAFWMTDSKHLKRSGFLERDEYLYWGSHPILAVWSWKAYNEPSLLRKSCPVGAGQSCTITCTSETKTREETVCWVWPRHPSNIS